MNSIFQFSNVHWNVSLSQRHFLSFASKDNGNVVIINLQKEVGLKIEASLTTSGKATLIFSECTLGNNGKFFGEIDMTDLLKLADILVS